MIRIKVLTLKQILLAALAVILAIVLLVLLIGWITSAGDDTQDVLQPFPSTQTAQPSQAPQISQAPEATGAPAPSQPQAPAANGGAMASSSGQAPALSNLPANGDNPQMLQAESPQDSSWRTQALGWLCRVLFGADPTDARSIVACAIPGAGRVTYAGGGAISAMAPAEGEPSWDEQYANLPSDIRIEVEKLDQEIANEPKPSGNAQVNASGKKIFIYHTHSREAYTKGDQDYVETSTWRTADKNYNVMRVGDELKKQLESRFGIAVDHNMTDHEPPSQPTAYERSMQTLQAAYNASPDTDYFIDLHRDAWIEGTKYSKNITVNGKPMARVMFVVDSSAKVPNWKENYKIAVRLTNEINAIAPDMAKPVRVVNGHYNQQVATGCLLMEVGHNENTVTEAANAMEIVAQAIAQVLGAS
nr:stage II sporulation protein P [Maliibacterium massiliense]